MFVSVLIIKSCDYSPVNSAVTRNPESIKNIKLKDAYLIMQKTFKILHTY